MSKNNTILISSALLIISAWLGSGILLYKTPNHAELGDMFGVINSLFSGLGLAGLIYTLLLQRESLETQRNELKKQESELKNQSEELEKQRFESSFIQILQIHNNLTRSLRIFDEKSDKFIHGVDCFSYLLQELYATSPDFTGVTSGIYPRDKESFQEAYNKLRNKYDNNFSHYLRSIYHLLKFIDSSSIDEKSKPPFYKMVRGRLTSDELRVIFYNCIYHEKDDFNNLIANTALLKYIPNKEWSAESEKYNLKPESFG
ncbi:putative phage abortive infection protein [Endozoicomonas sp. 8E]|uniref:putative phage abortive infection protein n=1 Tax=unclassified Endozoicomonas TaxID=2644528 RepID=UPI00293939AB|nr:putative phage abortive infection protein [Endozoicomonas sp. 8E]WOG26270.1 putative phage abortive infection protein [Endozoicomonas sp. 8E]